MPGRVRQSVNAMVAEACLGCRSMLALRRNVVSRSDSVTFFPALRVLKHQCASRSANAIRRDSGLLQTVRRRRFVDQPVVSTAVENVRMPITPPRIKVANGLRDRTKMEINATPTLPRELPISRSRCQQIVRKRTARIGSICQRLPPN